VAGLAGASVPQGSARPPVMTPSQLKATQPMRIVEADDDDDPATADTIPPAESRAESRERSTAAPSHAAATPPTGDTGSHDGKLNVDDPGMSPGGSGAEGRRGSIGSIGSIDATPKVGPGGPDHAATDPAAPGTSDDDIADDKTDETVEIAPVAPGGKPDAKPTADLEVAPGSELAGDAERVRAPNKDKDAG